MALVDDSNVTIAHLGIVSGIIDNLGIGEYIDHVMPKNAVTWSLMVNQSKHYFSIV